MHRHKPAADAKVVLPITPMLDMTFQLLFFFIMNFNPRPQEGVLDMALPTEEEKAAHNKENINPKGNDADNNLELKSDVTVKVRTQLDQENQGRITSLFIRNNEGKDEPITPAAVAAEKEDADVREQRLLAALKEDLTKRRDTLTNKDAIKVQGDGTLKVHSIMKVVDVCRSAGFKNTSFVQPEDFGR